MSLLWSLVEVVHSQTAPYVSFSNQTLANHSYVDLSQVGIEQNGSDSVQCITDLNTCCSSGQGTHRGDWYFPDGDRLSFNGDMRFVLITYVVGTMLPRQLVSIAAILQLLLSMMKLISQWEMQCMLEFTLTLEVYIRVTNTV